MKYTIEKYQSNEHHLSFLRLAAQNRVAAQAHDSQFLLPYKYSIKEQQVQFSQPFGKGLQRLLQSFGNSLRHISSRGHNIVVKLQPRGASCGEYNASALYRHLRNHGAGWGPGRCEVHEGAVRITCAFVHVTSINTRKIKASGQSRRSPQGSGREATARKFQNINTMMCQLIQGSNGQDTGSIQRRGGC